MKRYFIIRWLSLVPVIIGVTLIVFLILHLTPGDPAQLMLGPLATPQELAKLREELGLKEPLPVQYFTWLTKIAQGDFSRSISLRKPVLPEVLTRLQATLLLASVALLPAILLGTATGLLGALYHGRWLDQVLRFFITAGLSVPAFWLGMLLIYLFSVYLGWLPSRGITSAEAETIEVGDVLLHLILPAITLMLNPLALIARTVRTHTLEVLQQDYIRTARAKGLTFGKIITAHILKNTLLSLITVIGLQTGNLLGGAVLVEIVFSWPGIGSLLFTAITTRDYLLVQGTVVITAFFYMLIGLVADLLYAWADPRLDLS